MTFMIKPRECSGEWPETYTWPTLLTDRFAFYTRTALFWLFLLFVLIPRWPTLSILVKSLY